MYFFIIFFTPEQIDIDDYTCTKNCGPPTNYSEAFIMYHKTLSTEIGASVRYVNYYVLCIYALSLMLYIICTTSGLMRICSKHMYNIGPDSM